MEKIPSNLVELLQEKTAKHSEDPLFTFLVDGEFEEIHQTYAELDRKARQIAAALQERGLKGQRAVLLYPPGLDYISGFMGCLYAGVVAVPAYPPDPSRLNRTLPRLIAIIQDCQAQAILTTESIRSMGEFLTEQAPELGGLQWLATDALPESIESFWKAPSLSRDSLAFLQYTSGSTGHPKGVMLTHGNLLNNLEIIRNGFEVKPSGERAVFWLPPYHDMGLIGGILGAIYSHVYCVLMSPLAFLQKPFRWLQALSRFKGTVSGAPNFAYELCLKKVTPEQRDSLDLSQWSLAFSGAEPIRPHTLNRFAEYFGPCGFKLENFYTCYGLAEGTLMVSGSKKGKLPLYRHICPQELKKDRALEVLPAATETLALTASGKSFPGQKLLIVDPQSLKPANEEEVGEIWVQGPSIAQGYWSKPEETERGFRAQLDTGEGPFLRTGDLGFLQQGQLYVTGRLKDLIIIRGSNHYPQDIELTVEQVHPALRSGCGAAFSVEAEGEERLVVVQEVAGAGEELLAPIRRAIAERHELQAYAVCLLKKGSIPKTSSGKIRRHACREEFLSGQLERIAEYRAAPIEKKVEALADSRPARNGSHPAQSSSELESYLRAQLAQRLGIRAEEIDAAQAFSHYGLDSKEAVGFSGDLEEVLGRAFSPTLLWQYPTLESLLNFLQNPGESSVARVEVNVAASQEPIAVIGLACRFPQAPNPEAFWKLLSEGVDAITEVPADRWEAQRYYDPQPATPGKMNTRWGAFLDKVDCFDAACFGISPREASRMDPQQRILLEVASQALEDAGIQVPDLAGSRTGVFVGISSNDYAKFLGYRAENLDAYTGTGNAHSIAANRLSYHWDLRGPSMAVDTACSSSLVSVHLACESLRRGESNLALAGGVNLILAPELTITFSQARMMSSTGRCKTFDASADGYVRGEGCGMVILKRLSDATRDRDRVLAVLPGSAVNQDGRSNGLTAPNGRAQQEVIRQALAQAGVVPSQLSYVEAHGTGTPLGDPIELESLGAVLKEGNFGSEKCLVGSVKTNLGHLESAAGIAGLIKVILAMVHEEIPPHLHFQKINPHIPMDKLPLEIPTQRISWPRRAERPRLAGVSSFGFGGTNAHMLVAEGPPSTRPPGEGQRPLHLLKLSARSPEALKQLAVVYREALEAQPQISLGDFAYSANIGRGDFEYRHCLAFLSRETLLQQLQELSEGEKPKSPVSRVRPKLAFLFTGQGSQFAGMARELYATQPTFRKVLEKCNEILRPILPQAFLQVLFPAPGENSDLDETAFTQPVLYALEWALVELWRSWGIVPDYVMGHSVGEYVAAALAGVFSWEDGLRLIAERAALMQSLPKDGGMLAVVAEAAQVREWIAPHSAEISIAAVNGPRNTVLSGRQDRLSALAERLRAQGVAVQELKVSHAFHSSLMDPILEKFETQAARVSYQTPSLPLVSNLTGKIFGEGEKPDAVYWRRHLRETVLFKDGIRALLDAGCEVFLEIGPQPTLCSLGKRCAGEASALWLSSLKRGQADWTVLASSAAELYLRRFPLDWKGWDADDSRLKLSIPTYPFERERHWLDLPVAPSTRFASRLHPLLQEKIPSAQEVQPYHSELDLSQLSYLKDHRVGGENLLPATAFLEMALAAAEDFFGTGPFFLKDWKLQQALFLEEKSPAKLQVLLNPESKEEASLKIFSQKKNAENTPESWVLHVAGRVGRLASAVSPVLSFAEIRERCPRRWEVAEFYAQLKGHGLDYGPAFQGVQELWQGEGEAVARLALPNSLMESGYQLHPALLDAGIQVLAAAFGAEEAATYVPVGFAEVKVFAPLLGSCFSWAQVQVPEEGAAAELREGRILLFGEEGRLLAEIRGLRLQRLGAAEAEGEKLDPLLYQIEWKEQEQKTAGVLTLSSPSQTTAWLLFGGTDSLPEQVADLLRLKGKKVLRLQIGEKFKKLAEDHFELDPERREDWEEFFHELHRSGIFSFQGWVHLLGTEPLLQENWTPESLDQAGRRLCGSVLKIAQALARQEQTQVPLWLVTRGSVALPGRGEALRLDTSLLWGLGKTLALENVDGPCRLVDLPFTPSSGDAECLLKELSSSDLENQIALREGKRWVSRLVSASSETARREELPTPAMKDEAFRLEIVDSGTLEGAKLRRSVRHPPRNHEIEIEVRAAGLNFSDVLKVLGLYPGIKDFPVPLGAECSGKVIAVGADVRDFQPGDEVIAVAPFCFGRYVTTPADLSLKKPKNLSFEEAATLPIPFLTATYALHHLGRLQSGEKILIHAAAGGVGLAALQIAQAAGAEIFATAGSPEKRVFLKSLGVAHVMDSRTLDFAEEIRAITGGGGVDLVLNSLAGEFIPKSLSVLAPYGRFLEIGKTDIYQNSRIGLEPFQNNLSYFAIDLDRMFRERQNLVRTLFSEILQKFEQGTYRALPRKVFSIREVAQAFRYMAQRKNIGKVVVTTDETALPLLPASRSALRMNPEAAYLITGGAGALGLAVASELARSGAKHLVLMGRRPPVGKAATQIERLKKNGTEVTWISADVADSEELGLFSREPVFKKLRGIFHCAGVLSDGLLLNQSWEDFEKVLRPKVLGAFKLHELSVSLPLDFFVLFSSLAAVVGSPGQANYAAANAFLDALAQERYRRGLPALSINWGPWAGVGMAAQTTASKNMNLRGLRPFSLKKGLSLFRHLLASTEAQAIAVDADWELLGQALSRKAISPLFSTLQKAPSAPPKKESLVDPKLREKLSALDPERRHLSLQLHIQAQVARVLGIEASRLDPTQPLNALGLDSLMAIELKNEIEVGLQVVLPIATLLKGPSLAELASQLIPQIEAWDSAT